MKPARMRPAQGHDWVPTVKQGEQCCRNTGCIANASFSEGGDHIEHFRRDFRGPWLAHDNRPRDWRVCYGKPGK